MEKLWHYTSQQAALNIWNEKKLRLSSIDFVNDGTEQIFFLKELDSFLSSYNCEESKRIRHLIYYARHRLGFGSSSYISCFSREGDDVSQWERYADGAQGVSICFDKDKLLDISNLTLDSIRYKTQYQLQEFFAGFRNSCGFNHGEWSEMILKKSFFFKQSQFKSEQEIRIIMRQKEDELKKDNFYSRNDTICPCIYLDISEDAFVEIKLGPKSRTNAVEAWKALTDPNFFKNNINKWGNMSDDFPYKTKIPITRSSCSLL